MANSKQQLDLEMTVMALREELMLYFKHTCIDRMVSARIEFKRVNESSERRYVRDINQQKDTLILMLNDVPLLTLQRSPDTVIFHDAVLGRSKQLQSVKKELEKFFKKYLRGVERKHSNATIAI